MQPIEAIRTWGHPISIDDISAIFVRYLLGGLEVIPWCDIPLMEETDSIRDSLLKLNASPSRTEFAITGGKSCELQGKAWWTVGSQPAVDGIDSTDPAFGFGPHGGYVYQKAFVEFFVSQEDKEALKANIEAHASEIGGDGVISYFAGDHKGNFETNVEGGKANAVTWAVFPGQEIVQPTIIEEESFKAWCEEAFAIWTEWESLFAPKSPSQKLLQGIREERWLMTIVHHDFKDQKGLWRFLGCE
jgi:methylenetetrahydrofolate reductase (NADPH)